VNTTPPQAITKADGKSTSRGHCAGRQAPPGSERLKISSRWRCQELARSAVVASRPRLTSSQEARGCVGHQFELRMTTLGRRARSNISRQVGRRQRSTSGPLSSSLRWIKLLNTSANPRRSSGWKEVKPAPPGSLPATGPKGGCEPRTFGRTSSRVQPDFRESC
jgi:hypothetical protein